MNKISKTEDRKISQFLNFMEEFLWFIDTKKIGDMRDAPNVIRKILENNQIGEVSKKYSSINQNKNMLVGILPNFLQDPVIFKTNIDISDFAYSILNLSISRPEKRSKYELIGLISCEINNYDDSALEKLVNALYSLTNNADRLKNLKEAKMSSNFSWNIFLENYK